MAKARAKTEREGRLRKEISERLIVLRKHFGLSQSAMAEALGISRTTLYRIEKGELWPPLAILKILSEKFNVSLSWLISDTGEMIDDGVRVPDTMESSTFEEREYEEIKKLLDHFEKVPLVRHAVLGFFLEYINKHKDAVDLSSKEYDRFTERKRAADDVDKVNGGA